MKSNYKMKCIQIRNPPSEEWFFEGGENYQDVK